MSKYILLLLCIFVLLYVIAEGAPAKAKVCIPTTGGTAEGACCKFPFTYKGNTYKRCTPVDYGRNWCYTTKPDKWGHCPVCIPTTGGTAGRACCKFPFTWKGKTYEKCASVDRGRNWCYTFKPGKWGNCPAAKTTENNQDNNGEAPAK